MRIEEIHATVEAARDERARYFAEAISRGVARVTRAVRRRLATGSERTQRPRRRTRTGSTVALTG